MNQSALNPVNAAFCAALKNFCETEDVSIRRLVTLLSGTVFAPSKTHLHRLINGQANDRFVERIRPLLAQAVADLLRDRGLSPNAVDAKISELFNSEELLMIADRCPLTPEAVRYFGLRHDPFDVDRLPVGDELFTNSELDAVAARVRDAVLYQRFVAVIGSVGSGKTLLKLRVTEEVGDKARLLYPEFFDMSEVTVHGIANKILAELGQKIPQNKEARVTRIKEVLTSMQQEGTPVAIVLDECHRLNDRVISSLKNFWEMTNGRSSRLIGVILFGQPAFVESRLRDSIFREIRQRVQVIAMPELGGNPHGSKGVSSARSYIAHRITFAGGSFESLFDPDAVKRIAVNATTPLAIGNLANEALMSAMAAEEKRVTLDLPYFKNLPTGSPVLGIRRSAA